MCVGLPKCMGLSGREVPIKVFFTWMCAQMELAPTFVVPSMILVLSGCTIPSSPRMAKVEPTF